MNVRYKHMIITLGDDKKATSTLVFPSVNQAKRHNRLKLGGAAKIVHRRPANGPEHQQNNARCDKGE